MICGIDPGRFKIGFAAAEGEDLIFSAIIPKTEEKIIAEALINGRTELLSPWLKEGSADVAVGAGFSKIYVGDGTSSDEIKKLLDADMRIETVKAYGTTLEGRKLYWHLHRPQGLWKLIPTSLRMPPRDIDDLAAWAIIKIGLKSEK